MNVRYRVSGAVFFLFMVVVPCVHAEVVKEIRFAPGSTETTVKESVVRGERDYYTVTAKAGQTLELGISALEENAAFSLYKPPCRIVTKPDGKEVTGETLPGAGEEDDATSWSGVLPASGRYVVSVGGTRGNASYELKVRIR